MDEQELYEAREEMARQGETFLDAVEDFDTYEDYIDSLEQVEYSPYHQDYDPDDDIYDGNVLENETPW